MPNQIGISFMPTAENQGTGQAGPTASPLAPSTDLAQAYKILSLRLPTVVGARAPVASALLTSPGSGAFGGMNPYAALFQALIKAGLNGGGDLPGLGDAGPASGASLPGRVVPKISFPASLPGRVVPKISFPQDPRGEGPAPTERPAPPEYQGGY
jgi:hypothetical protein